MWSRNKANLYIRDALDDFYYDPKALPSPIAQRKIYRNKLMLTHLVGFGGGVSGGLAICSYDFGGTAGYLSIPHSTDFEFGGGNFTIDLWVKTTYTGWAILTTGEPNVNRLHMNAISLDSANSAGYVELNGMYSAYNAADGNWNHMALVRNGDDFSMYVNGVSQVTETESGTFPPGEIWNIGRNAWDPRYFDGLIDEFRASKGVARWTANFTPPTAEYTSDANTQLLIHCHETIISGTSGAGATFVDSGNTGHTITEHDDCIRISDYKF